MNFIPTVCPNKICVAKPSFIKKGFHYVKHLNRKYRIFQCKSCSRYFTSRTFRLDYRHKRSDLNAKIALLLIEGNSLRSISRTQGLTYNNTCKKFHWLKKVVEMKRKSLSMEATEIQFDELETIEHTKCKPLNIVLVVNEKYQLLAAKVAIAPAKGKVAAISRKRYGFRANERKAKTIEALTEVKDCLMNPPLLLKSDLYSGYLPIASKIFPNIPYRQYSAKEKKKKHQERMHENLKKRVFDPLFVINHMSARLRSNIKRLVRRSWCTTKKIEYLQLNLDLYILDSLGVLNIRPNSAIGLAEFGGFG